MGNINVAQSLEVSRMVAAAEQAVLAGHPATAVDLMAQARELAARQGTLANAPTEAPKCAIDGCGKAAERKVVFPGWEGYMCQRHYDMVVESWTTPTATPASAPTNTPTNTPVTAPCAVKGCLDRGTRKMVLKGWAGYLCRSHEQALVDAVNGVPPAESKSAPVACEVKLAGCLGTCGPRPAIVSFRVKDDPMVGVHAGKLACAHCSRLIVVTGGDFATVPARRCVVPDCKKMTAGRLCQEHFLAAKKDMDIVLAKVNLAAGWVMAKTALQGVAMAELLVAAQAAVDHGRMDEAWKLLAKVRNMAGEAPVVVIKAAHDADHPAHGHAPVQTKASLAAKADLANALKATAASCETIRESGKLPGAGGTPAPEVAQFRKAEKSQPKKAEQTKGNKAQVKTRRPQGQKG